MSASEPQGSSIRNRTWAPLTLVGIAVYVALDIILQLLPPHYSPIRQAESDLGVGPYGWLMSVNFVLRGALTATAATAIATAFPPAAQPRFGLILLWVFGVCSALLAFFPTDILDDRRLVPHPVATVHGEIHLLLALIAFVAAPLGALLISFTLQRAPQLAPARTAAVALAVASAFSLLLLRVFARHHAGGLDERIFLACVLAWLAILAVRTCRARAPA